MAQVEIYSNKFTLPELVGFIQRPTPAFSFSQLQRSRPKVEVDKQDQDVKMLDGRCFDFSKVIDSLWLA